jgi:membrane dipeptidase
MNNIYIKERTARIILYSLIIIVFSIISCSKEIREESKENKMPKELTVKELRAKADSLARSFIIIDTHVDLPYRLVKKMEDVSKRTVRGEFDYPRAIEGGLNAAFMSIYTPSNLEAVGKSKKEADKMINLVEKLASEHPDKFKIAYSVADVTKQSGKNLIYFPLGMENGSPVEGDLYNLKYFYDKGIRYITLVHSKNNHISDSSYDKKRKWNGLSPFGKKVIEEMNRLGIMVDVSHISDSAFLQVMKISKAPVIASHSSCRYFTPGWERNMSDEMIKLLAEKGGVIQINFGSMFLRDDIRKKSNKIIEHIAKYNEENNPTGEEANEYRNKYLKEHHPGYADIKDVVNHIDHVVKLVGVDHVGLGSDFEGVGDSLPIGLKDVSDYPNLILELLQLGYSDEEIKKICGGNILRVWSEVEMLSKKIQSF